MESFVEYLITSGDFRDPISRTKLTVLDIDILDKRITQEGLKYPALIDKYNDKLSSDTEANAKNVICGLESCIGEIVVDILRSIETPTKTASFQLTLLLSEIDVPFQEMKKLNLEAAYQAIETWKMFLKGPPKKPTADASGRLKYAISYFDCQWTAEDNKQLSLIRSLHLKPK